MLQLHSVYQQAIDRGNIEPDPIQARTIDVLDDLLQQIMQRSWQSVWQRLTNSLSKPAPIRGVYLYGGVGRGKSMLMDMLHEHIPDTIAAQRVHFHAFMQQTHVKLHDLRQQDIDDPLPHIAKDIAATNQILCFDEFFVRDITDAMILGRLFEHLFTEQMVVVATSNTAIADLYAHGLQRQQFLPFIALFQQQMTQVHLGGNIDYRTRSLNSLTRYYALTQQDQFDQAFASAIKGLHNSPLEVMVMGRVLQFNQHFRGILRCDFATLCDVPLAAQDYLAVSQQINTLFVDAIPKLDDGEHDDAARRLLYLIDCLYEAKCRVFLCATAAINQSIETLYQNGRLKSEFARAASRLREMQTAEYDLLIKA